MRGLCVLLGIVLSTISPSAAVSSVQAQPAAGRDQVVIGTSAQPDVLNLMFSVVPARFTAGDILSAIFTSDVELDNTWKPTPQGAASLPSIKDGTWSVDGERMTLVWKIKPRQWHDGRPVTCSDYVLSHTVARDTRVPVNGRDLTNRIANITCPKGADATEIVVTWRERYAYANLTITEYGALPRHIVEPFFRTNPSRLRDAPFGNDPRATIGDGPYRLIEWRKGESLTVESVGNHPVFGVPKIRRFTWRFLPDFGALEASMLSGAIDVINNGAFGPNFARGVELERKGAGKVKVLFAPGHSWEHIDFNLDNPLLQDVRVRRAIAHGINRTEIVQQFFQGRVPVSHSYLPPRHAGFTDTLQKYPHDPSRARALLLQAGFSPGPDGIMRNVAGQRLSLEINTTLGVLVREQIVLLFQLQLREVGIEITILNFPARVLFGETLGRRKFRALAFYAWIVSPDFGCDGLFTSDGIPTEANGWSGQNYPGYKNAEMDRVCKAASREIDETKRDQLFNTSARLFALDLPALPIYYGGRLAAAKTGLQNVSMGFPCARCVPSESWNMRS